MNHIYGLKRGARNRRNRSAGRRATEIAASRVRQNSEWNMIGLDGDVAASVVIMRSLLRQEMLRVRCRGDAVRAHHIKLGNSARRCGTDQLQVVSSDGPS